MKLSQLIIPRTAAVFLLAVLASVAIAQGLPTAKPEAVGMSSSKLKALKVALQSEVDQGKFPGAVVMIARNGKLVFSEAVGNWTKSLASRSPKTPSFAFTR